MGVRGMVFHTGCPSVDLAVKAVANPDDRDTIVVLQHPVTNEAEESRAQIEETIAAIEAFPDRPVLWFWPGQDAGEEGIAKALRLYQNRIVATASRTLFRRHIDAADFLSLLRGCACLVGNSSAGIRESAALGLPVVDLGTRQSGRERGPNVFHAPYDRYRITEAIKEQLSHGRYPASDLYGDGHAGCRIARILLDPADCDLARDLGRRPGEEGVERLPEQSPAPLSGL
jgi:UDP-N-acetylglucosamine 2-epimerase